MARRSDHTREELSSLILDSARRIVRADGIEALSARKLAAGIGYTVGTIYQHFGGMDDLVHRLNAETLQSLYEHCTEVRAKGTPGEKLKRLADAFIDFARQHEHEWEAVITYRYGPEHDWSPDYDAQVSRLLGLMEDATSSLYTDGEQKLQHKEMRLLWISLYGAFALDASGRLGKGTSLSEMIEMLVATYLAAKA